MRERLVLFLALAAPASLSAQTVFPRGYDRIEGASRLDPLAGPESNFQQIYYGSLGAPIAGIRSLTMRRDAFAAGGGAHTLTCRLLVGHGKTSGWSRTYASNYVGSPSTVFAGTLRLPDKTRIPGTGPGPFDIGIVFQRPFHYSGKAAFVWQLIVTKSSAGNATASYPVDMAISWPQTFGSSRSIGAGCKTSSSGASTFRLLANVTNARNRGSAMELMFRIERAPRTTSVLVLVGLKDLNLAGLFCTTIHTDALVAVPLGSSSFGGLIDWRYVGVGPWKPAYRGVNVYTQAAAIQVARPSIGLKFSQASRITLPSSVASPPAVKVRYLMDRGRGSSTRSAARWGPFAGGVVVQVSR